ncbi:GtrA family protein [Chlorobium phaeobacteroides]|uniref:GtrA family protein n=1 Tax=Chlorobium phaeobacteroides TaxID=1096 RepID=UPI00167F36F7|nr:GtrA family protein [Chlorobium phaeobacteroides]
MITGIFNTLVGYGTFFVFYRFVNLSPELSNAIGYGIGLISAFILNRLFVFKRTIFSFGAFLRFVLSFIISFILNLAILYYFHRSLHVIPEIAQIAAMIAYTIIFYLLNKYFVWKHK